MKKLIALFLATTVLIAFPSAAALPVYAGTVQDARPALEQTVSYLLVQEKQRGPLSPFSYIAFAGAGQDLKGTLVEHVCTKVLAGLATGETNNYSIMVFLVLSIGEDPSNYRGQNLLEKIQKAQLAGGKFADNVITGGQDLLNAHTWAILAIASAGAQIPEREQARQWLIAQQHEDGSFCWYAPDKNTPDVDSTGMALMALGALGERKGSPVAQKAIRYLQSVQKENGGFESWGVENPESCSMVIQGLTAVGIDPAGSEFGKPGGNPITAMLGFQLPDGSFEHLKDGGANEMATQQALMALSDVYYGNALFERLKKPEVYGLPGGARTPAGYAEYVVRFKVGEKHYTVNVSGKQESKETDLASFIENGRTYVPLRYLAFSLGIPEEGIKWSDSTRTVTLASNQTTVALVVGKTVMYVNDKLQEIEVAPLVREGRTCLPARYVAGAFGYDINWDPAARTVIVAKAKL